MKYSNAISKILVAVLWCGVSVGCVAEEVKQPAIPAAPAKAAVSNDPQQKFILTRGKNYPLCQDYLALMNRVPRNPHDTCGLEYSFDAEAKAKGFKEINWVEVEPKENEKLLLDYWMYMKQDWKSEEDKGKKREEFYSDFFPQKLQLWKSTFDLNNDGKPELVYSLVGVCAPNNITSFMPSEKGFASTNYGERIDVFGSVFTYQGRTFLSFASGITEPFSGNGREKIPEFVNQGPTVCEFTNEMQLSLTPFTLLPVI
jgi:hypothetical protein